MQIKRAISLKLFSTQKKKRKIIALIDAYRAAVNFYLNNFTKDSKLNKETLALLQNSKLSQRYKSNALKQALGIYKSLRNNKKIPVFKGFPVLDAKFVSLEKGQKSFDLVLRLSTLAKGKKIVLPTKKTSILNKWLKKGSLIQGCELHEDKIIVWINIEKEKTIVDKESIGIDLGMNKLLTTSQGQIIGKDFSSYVNKILNKKKNSKAYKRAVKAKNNYVNWCVNQLPWDKIGILAYENLKFITKGKNGRRKFRNFRVKQQYWTVRKVITRILEKCQENRVRPVYVNPRNTSRTCPSCTYIAEHNRKDECFCCLACGYKQDADIVGATNILNKALQFLGSLESPNSQSKTICFY